VRAASGQSIAVDGRIDARKRSDAILVTAPFVADMDAFLARRDQVRDLSSALRLQHKAGTLLASYCTGSYLLAEAGLLDHRIATTHWSKAADFSRRYPKVELRSREVLTEQSGILCGGAVTSYLNLAVRLVERLTDSKLAMLVAKTLLIDVNRASQASYATLLDDQGHTDQLVVRAQRQMEATLQQRFRMSDLAAHLAVSERTRKHEPQSAARATSSKRPTWRLRNVRSCPNKISRSEPLCACLRRRESFMTCAAQC
jgi:transcriptional regulator GlxA family with amidase domain